MYYGYDYNFIMNLDNLKWTATTLLIVGFGLVTAGYFPGVIFQFSGGMLWLIAAIIMKDKPLITTNAIMTIAGVIGLIYRFF